MEPITLLADEAKRILELLRVTHRSMRELADVVPQSVHEDFDLLTASMAEEVRECLIMLERK